MKIKQMILKVFVLSVFVIPSVLLTQCAHGPKKEVSKSLKAVQKKGNSLYYYVISELQAMEGKSQNSLFYLDKAIKKDPHSAYLMTDKAYQLARENKLDEAQKMADQTYQEHPNDVELLILLGKIASAKGDHTKSIQYYQKVIAQNPKHEEAYNLIAREYMAENENKKAIASLKKLIHINPDALSAYFYLGSIYASPLTF